uniref:G-protein coupled receptors family 1 profile domain-containing protein n=1 Tax=Anopheles melas TaxID=34690 RepID=A0A182TXM8_9DIPT
MRYFTAIWANITATRTHEPFRRNKCHRPFHWLQRRQTPVELSNPGCGNQPRKQTEKRSKNSLYRSTTIDGSRMGGFPFERTTVDSFLSRYTTETSIPTATTTVTAVEELFFNVTSSSDSLPTANGTLEVLVDDPPTYSLAQIIILGIIATVLSILTVAGNVMVMISFKIDKQLQTISNYFLFSLAIADFAIGLISMPLFSVTTLLGYWPLGPHICDTWLALDYLASNASVLNLLIISFDRYFSVTRPLTYRAKRTTTRAAIMIGAAWGISLLLWPPWIYSWPYIEGKRTVPEKECYIQFIETNHYITFGTAIAAFYVPVTVMCFLYYRIWRETKKRQKELKNLTGDRKKDSSKRSNSR